jgi:hypothetical protein
LLLFLSSLSNSTHDLRDFAAPDNILKLLSYLH